MEHENHRYVPFGEAWEAYLMKRPKKLLIQMFRNSQIDPLALQAAEARVKVLEKALEAMCEDMAHSNWGIKSPAQWQTESYKCARALLSEDKNI